VNLKLWTPAWSQELSRAKQQSESLGAPLEVAVFQSDDAGKELDELLRFIGVHRPRVARWLIFHRNRWSADPRDVEPARQALHRYDDSIPIGSGTNANFMELNRRRPPVDIIDFVVYSIHPQEHAYDNASLVETLEAQAATVESARQFAGELPVVISPVTLRKQVNPYATGPDPESAAGELPRNVDPRQMSLFGAAWTLGSVKFLAESGVHSVTYYETHGWRGVTEADRGSPLPEKFHSLAGSVFPLYHVLSDFCKVAGARVFPVSSSDPLLVNALAVRTRDRFQIMIANMSPEDIRVDIRVAVQQVRLRVLDESNAVRAMQEPDRFREQIGSPVRIENQILRLDLRSYAYAWMEAYA
jgi:hypothetical protein